MSLVEESTPTVCVNHPRRDTVVRCSKCGDPICTRCMIQTPVGMRCRRCAGLKRMPQFDLSPALIGRSAVLGLLSSIGMWYILAAISLLMYFLSIFVGVAVGAVMSRAAKRRSGLPLEVAAVLCIVAGRAIVEWIRYAGNVNVVLTLMSQSQSYLLSLVLPVAIASFVAVVKLR